MSKKILMVCLGNICRSPLAEGIFKSYANEHQLDWEVDSCGTSGFHDGEPPDPRSIEIAKKNGIDITRQISRRITKDDIDSFDVIFAMDTFNYNEILGLCDTKEQEAKVRLILNLVFPDQNRSVPDPYYDNSFGLVFDMLSECCKNFAVKAAN